MMQPHTLLSLVTALLLSSSGLAQLWQDHTSEQRVSGQRWIQPATYRGITTSPAALWGVLRQAPHIQDVRAKDSGTLLELPAPDGTIQVFSIVEFPVMAPALQERYPNIRSYAGQGITDPSATLRLSMSPKGFHAMVISNGDTWYIDPLTDETTEAYQSYTKKAFYATTDKVFEELPPIMDDVQMDLQKFDESNITKYDKPAHDRQVRHFGQSATQVRTESGTELRTYRLALACTGEYATFHGGTVPDVVDAYNTSLTRVNGVYEREVAVHMDLVANNDNVIYLDAASDPYTNNSGGTMLGQNINTCNTQIGSANYDIGHVYSTGGGGVAYLQSPCGSNKAGGVTGQPTPVGDPFDIDYVCHEMGHQYGGNHTQNNSCNRSSGAAYEPGSASTIMGYAGICSPNLQSNSDDYFHIHSFNEMKAFTVNGNGNTCAVVTTTGNGVPTVDAGTDYTIPGATPFELTATGSDPDGDAITYTWEEYDLGPATASGDSDLSNPSGNQPTFRSWKGTEDPTRVFPRITDLINNTTVVGEHLPDYDRGMTFRCSVRDNRAGGGGVNEDEMQITVDGDTGPFLVNYPNGGEQLPSAGGVPVTWDVAGTDGAPVNCTSVDIYLSTDGGLSYPTLLLSGTANDGAELVIMPAIETTTARIKIKGNGNVFFDISNANVEITSSVVAAQYDAVINAINAPEGDYCSNFIDPEIQILNLGTETLTSADIETFVDGISQGVVNWTGALTIGSTELISLATIFPADGAHTYEAVISNPNGQADENPANNSQTTNFSTVASPNLVTFSLLTDCWGEEVGWTLTNQANGDVVASVSANTLADLTTYDTEFCLTEGCYDLTITDTYGDGLSGASYGSCGVDGDYSVTDNGGTVLVQMAASNYGASITETFCVASTVLGCTDNTACNYNPAATSDDGSCEFTSCAGCTDAAACNYDATATIEDGSCILPDGCTDATACNYDAAAACDDGSCEFTSCAGCTNAAACNYDATATIEDGSCILPDGCTDATACNYDAAAACDDGSCEFTSCAGCTNAAACNYDATATIEDGSCILPDGCTDATACNYDTAAACDDGSCEFTSCAGCTNAAACNYDATATIEDGSCILPDGCTDATACNYDTAAACDDGSCEFTSCAGCTNATACNYDATATIEDGSCILPDGCTDATACNYDAAAACDDGSCEFTSCAGCTDAAACNYDATATIEDGSCILPDGCTDATACNYDAAAACDDGSCEFTSCAGCTNAAACNYDATATIEDGSCILPDGCTDATACNYDAAAACDDGSCTYTGCGTCFGDLNGDGFINVSDLLEVLAEFGCTSGCTADLTGDDKVNSSDTLALLGVFGTSCD